MKLVIVESPYAGNVEENKQYARRCIKDCLNRGEAPFASHLLYTQPGILDDNDPEERKLGIKAGLMWGAMADATVVYQDYGITEGMIQGIETAESLGRTIEYRNIGFGLETGADRLVIRTASNVPWTRVEAPGITYYKI